MMAACLYSSRRHRTLAVKIRENIAVGDALVAIVICRALFVDVLFALSGVPVVQLLL